MFKLKTLAAACSVVAMAAAATPAMAAPYTPPSVTGQATVRLYDAIELLKVSDVDFGTVIRDASYSGGGVINMDALGATDCAAALNLTCTGATSAGAFTIKGDSGSDMSVTLSSVDFNPATNVLKLNNGSNFVAMTMAFSGMVQDAGQNTFSVTGSGSADPITVYGSIAVPAASSAPNGVYSTSFDLTADYK